MDVYLASANAHKLGEFVHMVHKARLPVHLHGAAACGGMPDVDESGATFEDNARIKAEALLPRVPAGAWVLADDSGLMVDALGGAPGVQSARYAGPGGHAEANMIKLLQALKGVPLEQRTARFRCVLYFVQSGGKNDGLLFSGSCEGHILLAPAGRGGFGYDPLFRPLGYNKTFAEIDAGLKHLLSHRARAVAAWIGHLRSQQG